MNIDSTVITVGAVVAAAVPIFLQNVYAKRAVGRPNGKGNLTQMAEALLLMFREHAENDETRFNAIAERMDRAARSVRQDVIVDRQEHVASEEHLDRQDAAAEAASKP